MRRLRNPFADMEGYNCFGCSPGNHDGLQMNFVETGDEIVSTWEPNARFQGYRNVLHGGIQATLLDEIASWVVYVKLKRSGVTSKMVVRYLKPVIVNGGTLTIRARVKEMRRNLADIEARVINAEGQVCSEAMITYFTFSPEKSRESFFYPEPEDFIES
jgi:uncharacterized protein (TIGR00369 family)